MLESFGPGIWLVDGSVVTAAAGFHYPTRMAVIRLSDGRLILWSPVRLSEALLAAVRAIGTPAWIVPPNTLHDSFVADWQRACPDAAVLAPPGMRQSRPDIAFDGDLDETGVAAWGGEVEMSVMRGNRITTEVVLFHRASATVLFADLLQQFPRGWFAGWRGIIARLDLMVGDRPAVPRKFRLAFADRGAARAGMRRILDWPAERVVIAHGAPVLRDGQAFLRQAFRWLGAG